jgi:hypothetical protein
MKRYLDMDAPAQQAHLVFMQIFAQGAADSGTTALKQVALANMGGVTAVLAFGATRGLDGNGRLVAATIIFCLGLISAMAAMGVSPSCLLAGLWRVYGEAYRWPRPGRG